MHFSIVVFGVLCREGGVRVGHMWSQERSRATAPCKSVSMWRGLYDHLQSRCGLTMQCVLNHNVDTRVGLVKLYSMISAFAPISVVATRSHEEKTLAVRLCVQAYTNETVSVSMWRGVYDHLRERRCETASGAKILIQMQDSITYKVFNDRQLSFSLSTRYLPLE